MVRCVMTRFNWFGIRLVGGVAQLSGWVVGPVEWMGCWVS